MWASSNLHYVAGLNQNQQEFLFSNLCKAGVKVICVWLDRQTQGSTKGTLPFINFPDLESKVVGTYENTVLNLVDGVMLTAHKYGIKLMMDMHSYNALAHDVYRACCRDGYFYEQANAIAALDYCLRHILNQIHTTLGNPWKSISKYIFAFEEENEAMIGRGADYIAQSSQCLDPTWEFW